MFWVDTDNIVHVIGLKSAETGSPVNDADIKMALFETIELFLLGAAVTANGGSKSTLPVAGHPFLVGDYCRIFGTLNYDGEYIIVAATTDTITITVVFVEETFLGTEIVQKATRDSSMPVWPQVLTYVPGSEGDYLGKLPNTLYLFPDVTYELVITEKTVNGQVLVKFLQKAGFKGF